MIKKKNDDYIALKRKLFLRILLIAALALALVLAFRAISTGKFATGITEFISSYFTLDLITASNIYYFGIRNILGVLIAVAATVLFLVLFRAFLSSYTSYLDEIAAAVSSLTQSGAQIQLSPELRAIESRLKTLQQSIERKDAQAKLAAQRKNDLVIYSAHDIKTPLTSVLGYLILLDGNSALPEEERKKYTAIALDKTRELDGMINELFEITRYNLNEIELEKTWLALGDMLSEIKEEHYPKLKAAGKRIQLQIADNTRVYADADKLARVFNNILANAVLYSEAESLISVSAATVGDTVRISFENVCEPIPEAKLKRLFEQFYRGGQSVPGSGIGLAIAREIVLLHGGEICAEKYRTRDKIFGLFACISRKY